MYYQTCIIYYTPPIHNIHAGSEAKAIKPTTRLTLFWAYNPFRGNFNHWQVSRKEAGQIFCIVEGEIKLP